MIYLYIALCICALLAVYYWGKSHGHSEGFKDGQKYAHDYYEWRVDLHRKECELKDAIRTHIEEQEQPKKKYAKKSVTNKVPKV